ncbi:thioredoxin [Baffinella frigidus]|nr:thioredoxin [Cryptophyta sp. CCMP2293]
MDSPGVVVLQCTAAWCEPCKSLSPKLEHAVGQCEGVTLARLDIDECEELAGGLKVESVPTLFLVHNKKMVAKVSGDLTNEQVPAPQPLSANYRASPAPHR